MKSDLQNVAVILAGGVGSRYGANIPKQYLMLKGKEVLWYAVNAAKNSKLTDKVLVVCDRTYQNRIKEEYGVDVCDGGDTRNKSVASALEFIKSNYDCGKICVLDSARPLITSDVIDDYFAKLDEYDCVVTTQKVIDSLGSYKSIYENREDFFLIQAPESMRFDTFIASFDENSPMTALCQIMPEGSKFYFNFDLKKNFKITYNGDLDYIGQFLG